MMVDLRHDKNVYDIVKYRLVSLSEVRNQTLDMIDNVIYIFF